MSGWQTVLPWLLPMLVLMVFSAFFSGSEAALFSLSPRDRRLLQRGERNGNWVRSVLSNPSRLLSAILFWNLVINLMYFSLASVVAAQLEAAPNGSNWVTLIFTSASLLGLIFFCEMLPKSLAVADPLRWSLRLGPWLAQAIRLTNPVLPLIEATNVGLRRLFFPRLKAEEELALSDVERAISLGTGDDHLASQERAILQHLVDIADTTVGEWMRPRSGLRIDSLPISDATFSQPVPADGYLFFAEADNEEITATIPVRRLRPSQLDDLSAAMESVVYAPWSAKVSRVFDLLTDQGRHVCAIVNEYGETIGILTVDDVIRQVLLGPDRRPLNAPSLPVDFQSGKSLQVSGETSARHLAKLLGVPRPAGRSVTVSGLIQRLNERVPRVGDVCQWENFLLQVYAENEEGGLMIEVRQTDIESPAGEALT